MDKKVGIAVLGLCLGLGGLVFAAPPDAGHGKMLFEDPALGGGTSGKSCKTCHAGGVRLGDDFAQRARYTIMGQEATDLAAVVNFCIKMPLAGSPIDPKGQDMADLIEYMKTLKAAKTKEK